MPITPDLPFPKSAGDSIRSKDWNDLLTETLRLDTAKVDRAGDAITGSLSIAGALHAGNSDLYFTRIDHDHTAFGNTAGYAAIENASNFAALMILGRSDAPHPTKPGTTARVVKLWDFLEVNGDLQVTGDLSINDGNVYLRAGDDNHGLGWFGNPSKLFGGINVDGPVLWGNAGGALGTALSGSQKIALGWDNAGHVGVGTPSPKAALHVVGVALVSDGDGGAVPGNFMASGSLTIGSNAANFGGGTGWNANTAGLLLETGDDTEIAIHDSGTRLASVVRYQSAPNSLTIGRDMGWGRISNVVLTGAVHAGNSDLYFTKIDHEHSGFGNTAGYAAIENTSNYDALMLLGRANAQHPTRPGIKARVVKLWDFLDVNGEMRVTGSILEVNGGGNERCYLGGDGSGGDVQLGSLNNSVQNVSMWNTVNGFMTVFAKNYQTSSDLTLKMNVTPLAGSLGKILALRGVQFDWKHEQQEIEQTATASPGKNIGLIAQEVAKVVPELVTETRGSLSVSYMSIIPLLVESIKELHSMIQRLQPSAGAQPPLLPGSEAASKSASQPKKKTLKND